MNFPSLAKRGQGRFSEEYVAFVWGRGGFSLPEFDRPDILVRQLHFLYSV